MKLPIALLLLLVLGHAVAVQPATKKSEIKSSEAKGSEAKSTQVKDLETKHKPNNQTSKRELYEGNYGERNKVLLPKNEVTGPPPKIEYANELEDMYLEQNPTDQIFGVRLPQIAKISDVLTGHSPSFEAAVAKHLYSPVSVYHAKFPSPTSYEVPAASESSYADPKSYKLKKEAGNQQKPQELPISVELPSPQMRPLYTVNQPRLNFEAYPQSLDTILSRQHNNLPQEIFQPQQVPRRPISSLFPIYDQLGPFRNPGHVVPTQYLHQNGVYQFVPVRPDSNYGGAQERNRGENNLSLGNQEQLKTEQPKLQIDIPAPNQGYHAHPNGAISFASFSQNLPVNTQYETAPQPQSNTFRQPSPEQLQSQSNPVQLPPQTQPEGMLQSQEQKLAPVKQKQHLSMLDRLIQDLQKYQPMHLQSTQLIPFKQQIQYQPRTLNALQQHLLYQDPGQSSNPQVYQLQRLPKFKPLPQSLLTGESYLQQSNRSPRPFSNADQSAQTPENYNVPIKAASQPLTPLPPLKPNYSKYVKPLEPYHTTPVFLPTPLQPLPTSTPKEQPFPDQLISSTTIKPVNVKGQEDPKEQSTPEETQPQIQISEPLKPEIIHQLQPTTARPPSIQSTTYSPFVNHGPQSVFLPYTTPQPQYQSRIRPESIETPPRHDVVIQRQELRELFFEPRLIPFRTPSYLSEQLMNGRLHEQELHHLRTQPYHQLYEQLQPLSYQQEIQDINSQQYRLEARHSQSLQKTDSSQQAVPHQYLIQQRSHPLQHHQLQSKLLQSQQPELENSQQQQQSSNQEQQEQQVSEQTQQQPQELEEAQQQPQISEQAQQQQYQQYSLVSNNEIQISTLKPFQDNEQQTETIEIQQQTESLSQPEQQSTTERPNKPSEHLTEATPNIEQPYLGPLLTPSVLRQVYADPQQLVAPSDQTSLLRVPSYSDVQYFGKYAETLFGNIPH